jgi:hypothetical protein
MRLALVAVVLVTATGCDAFYNVRGKVTSCANNAPVAGAKVDLSYPGEHGGAPTDDGGIFSVSANDPPGENPATLTVAARGFRAEKRTVHNGDDVHVCLQEESAPVDSAAPSPAGAPR